jgi:hypothetical protein
MKGGEWNDIGLRKDRHARMHTCIYIYIHIHTHTIRTCIHVLYHIILIYILYMYICAHTYVHTHTHVNPNFTVIITEHGKNRAYLHRFKILENATCPCNKGDQTIDHLINQYTLLQTHIEPLRNNVLKSGTWPVSKEKLIMKHLKSFLIFTKSVDFDQM